MRTHSAELLLLDMIMDPGMDGLRLTGGSLKYIRARRPSSSAVSPKQEGSGKRKDWARAITSGNRICLKGSGRQSKRTGQAGQDDRSIGEEAFRIRALDIFCLTSCRLVFYSYFILDNTILTENQVLPPIKRPREVRP